MDKKARQILFLILFLVVSLSAGYFGSHLSGGSTVETYTQLVKPEFFPPAWVFGPVWTVLYMLMGWSAYLVWRTKKDTGLPMKLFFVQLALNLIWPAIFFGLHQYLLAFVEIILLWAAIIMTILSFYRRSKVAAYLLIPYILWVSFAAMLNYIIFTIN